MSLTMDAAALARTEFTWFQQSFEYDVSLVEGYRANVTSQATLRSKRLLLPQLPLVALRPQRLKSPQRRKRNETPIPEFMLS